MLSLLHSFTVIECTWGNSSPSTPYTVNKAGKGPAWDNSLFEDNAEFGFGMYLAQKTLRESLSEKVKVVAEQNADVKAAADKFFETYDDTNTNTEAADALIAELEKVDSPEAKAVVKDKDFLAKKSQWIFGGDSVELTMYSLLERM